MVNSTERREVIKHEKKDDLNIKAAALSDVKKAEEKRFNVEILRYLTIFANLPSVAGGQIGYFLYPK